MEIWHRHGYQIDETGRLLGYVDTIRLQKYGLLINVWESVNKGVDFLIKFIDNETGSRPSYDLWRRIGKLAV